MNKTRRVKEFRATLKGLTEQRTDLETALQAILESAKAETRALTAEEQTKFEVTEQKIKDIDATIAAEERARKIRKGESGGTGNRTAEEAEIRAFANYIRSQAGNAAENRAGEQNLTLGNNGAIIPTTIANRIITEVKTICPIFEKATIYNIKGILKIPVWGADDAGNNITVAYQEEFTEITANSGTFTSVDLGGYLAGALALIGKSVINNTEIDIVSFIVSEMAKEIAAFLEKELLLGTENKATGALSTQTTITANSATAITADNLIDLQSKIKQAYQAEACWVMHPDTFSTIKKLKDSNNRYLLQDDYTSGFPYRLLGKPVYLSDNMPTAAAGKKAVLYGDLSGLSVNMRENIQIQILMEAYATKHAVGIVSWFEFDSKISENQKLGTLTMATA